MGLALQPELVGAGLPAGRVLVQHAALCEGHVPIRVHKDYCVGSEREHGAHVQPTALGHLSEHHLGSDPRQKGQTHHTWDPC